MVRMPRAAKGLILAAVAAALLCTSSAVSNSVNYRGQPQEDLTCMQSAKTDNLGATVVFRNDPSTNCFGFPSIQFDTLPVEGGKPNGITIDWSLMVDELQMQDDDRLHIHLPGFTGGTNTFGIMGPAINTQVKGVSYAPNLKSEAFPGDASTRADFGALVGIWGISCGTEANLYMDRAKVDNIRTAEWDPTREMLKVVLKARRFGPTPTAAPAGGGRVDGYTGNSAVHSTPPNTAAGGPWVTSTAAELGTPVPFSKTATDVGTGATPAALTESLADNSKSTRGNHLQAFEYSRDGPSAIVTTVVTGAVAPFNTAGNLVNAGGAAGATATSLVPTTTSFIGTYRNDGFVFAPGNRVCGLYIDPTKLHRAQKASQITSGIGPLPPYGGIGKNWYKLAYIRRFKGNFCVGGFTENGVVVRPGMSPETCSFDKAKTTNSLSNFWQVPFDGDSERVVGFQFTTTKQKLPLALGAKPYGTVQAPTFSFAQAKGSTDGPARDNCITVSLIPSVTFVSGTSAAQITIKGLKGTGTSDTDTLNLYMDDKCTASFDTLVGSNGIPIKNFQPVVGTAETGIVDNLLASHRPFGRMAFSPTGTPMNKFTDTVTYLDDVDWHTRARQGTISALTTGDPYFGITSADTAATTITLASSTLESKKRLPCKLSSPVGDLNSGNAAAKFVKNDGTLVTTISPGYFFQAGELLVFSFKLQNPKDSQPSQALSVSASGSYCDANNQFCNGAADQKLDIQDVPIVDKGKLLESKLPYFTTSKIFQASTDPDSLTTIFVTLKPNVDLKKPDSTADSKITISGLCGFQTGTNVLLYQNQKAGGMPLNNEYPIEAVRSKDDLPGLTAHDLKHIDFNAEWDAAGVGTLKIKLGTTGLVAEKTYAFAFQLQTGKVAHSACVPTISSAGGSETMLELPFAQATNVGLTMAPMFTTIKIGQVTTRPDVTNFLCVTLQHNYEFYTDSVVNQNQAQTGNYIESKITISGLLGTQAVSTASNGKGYALAYCPTEVPYFDDKTTQHTSTQFQPDVTSFTPKRYKTFGGTNCFGTTTVGTQACIPGNPYVPDDAFDTTVAGRSWFGGQSLDKDAFTWDQATGTAVLTVDADITKERVTNPQTAKGGIPKNAQIVFALPLQNSNTASGCKEVMFEASGRITQKATFTQTMTGRAIQDGEQDGDACALKVYEPGFLIKKMTQSSAVTGDDNVITVSLRSNVDFASIASGQASYITISGLTGSATGNGDLGITVPRWNLGAVFSPKFEKGTGVWVQSTGTLTLKIDAGSCVPPTVWANGAYYDWDAGTVKDAPFVMGGSDSTATATVATGTVVASPSVSTAFLGTTQPSVCVKAGYLYVFSFLLLNPSTEQAAPNVQISGRYRDANNNEVVVAPAGIDAPISNDVDKTPMRISDQTLTTFKIGQLIPAPAAINVICVTIQSSKDIKSQPNAPLSSITISGLTGFDASAQDLQLYENDGATIIPATTGNPATGAYKVGAVFSAQNTQNRGSEGAGFVRYDGSTTGNVIIWISGDSPTSLGVTFMQKNIEHKFCFRLKNPKSEMQCKDVSMSVNNQGKISTVKAEQDMTSTIEDYPFGSACAGYVAAPGFVVSNWRSSTNTTGGAAVIHLELATNLQLESGDKITISGLTSYTRSCPTPPCDVGVDVTRTAVSRRYGKPHVNGRRSVMIDGTGDAKAGSSERAAFAVAIQSFDLTGVKDDGKFTSTFGDNAAWGKVGDSMESASTLTFTVANQAKMTPADITVSADATLYEIVFTLVNKATPTESAAISINIGQGQTQYAAAAVNIGQSQPAVGISKVGDGGMEIAYTPQKTIFGGESLILTLPMFTRDTNGMLFGITSAPNTAFTTYSTWQDWKAYTTQQKYARAFFTNGWKADGITAKSGDAGQTGERWNYPNVNAKVTTDADYNHDTGVFVLDENDPGVGMNKNYWYANNEDNLYEGRVTRVAASAVAGVPGAVLTEPTPDYFLDNGEALVPIASADMGHYELTVAGAAALTAFDTPVTVTGTTTEITIGKNSNGYRRPHLVIEDATPAGLATVNSRNNLPGTQPTDAYRGKSTAGINTPQNNFPGTPPFKGIPDRFQPSRRDNFYRGMLMKCWVGTAALGGKTDYSELGIDLGSSTVVAAVAPYALTTGAGAYRASTTAVKALFPPPERIPASPSLESATAALGDKDLANAKAFEKAGISRTLETRVIQASFRQIDYIPRKLGGCHWSGLDSIAATATPIGGVFAVAGCQDEVPGYPAVVRLESPFSRTLDPDTLCYIQRKADVGVYTGMTAMIGNKEYTIKQGAANIYTVSHNAKSMTGPNGDPVDRKVPRSYSTEDFSASTASSGLRGDDNVFGFFSDGVGISGQPYTIYSQLELVAKKGSKVSVGETITITLPKAANIMPPTDINALITPSNDKDKIADKVQVSHVLLVPLSSACSIVSVYGVRSGCQYDNRRGGSFDLILSNWWPYAYDSENGNDLTGYGMTLFGAQSTVIKTMADKYSQDLPVRPLEGVNVAGAFAAANVLDPRYITVAQPAVAGTVGARVQRGVTSASQLTTVTSNTAVDTTFTVARELDTLYLTGGTARATAAKVPKQPNAPITLTDGGCGNKVSDTLGPATLPYAVCLSLGGTLAHNQFMTQADMLEINGGTTAANMYVTTAPLNSVVSPLVAITTGVPAIPAVTTGSPLSTPRANQLGVIVAGVQSITGAVGQDVTPVIPNFIGAYGAPAAPHVAPAKTATFFPDTYGSARPLPDGTSKATANPVPERDFAVLGTIPQTYENPADNLGLGAFIIVGVYTNGTSDRFYWAGEANKGTLKAALPTRNDMYVNHVVQRYIGTSRETIPLASVPSGLIGGNSVDKPTSGYRAPAGRVSRYQARVSGGYSIGRYGYGMSKIMNVRSDVTSNAYPFATQLSTTADAINANTKAPMAMVSPYLTSSALPTGLQTSGNADDDVTLALVADNHYSGFPAETSTPNAIEKIIYGRSTLPLPQVFHTASDQATVKETSRYTRGQCGQNPVAATGGAANTLFTAAAGAPAAADEACQTASRSEFNLNLPFSRNVYIEQGHDVYIISSLFDTLIQRPEPARQHLSTPAAVTPTVSTSVLRTIEGQTTSPGPGYYAASSKAVTLALAVGGTDTFPGFPGIPRETGIPGDSTALPRPAPLRPGAGAGAAGNFVDLRMGTIQTGGTPILKAGAASSLTANTGSAPTHLNQYGFDQDFRRYSVLGPFMRPAVIKDVWDSGKIISAYTSNFPGVLTIHSKLSTDPTIPTLVAEEINNNALYHTAPVIGTSYWTTADRATQYHTYTETDKIITFCNPLQSDLNNAPGAVLHNDISDDPVVGRLVAAGTELMNKFTGASTSNGKESTAPSQWTVPRRHHICRKMVTGAPELTYLDRNSEPHYVEAATASKARLARYRYTESVQYNNVLNQEPSPNMRAMVTFVEPTMISVSYGSEPICEVAATSFDATKVDTRCASFTIKGKTSKIVLPGGKLPDWFTLSLTETAHADFADFGVDQYPDMVKGVSGERKRGVTTYDKKLVLGDFLNLVVPERNTWENETQRVTFRILQTAVREASDDDRKGVSRRRLLATCASGFDARLIQIGQPIKSSCTCDSACGVDEAACSTTSGGTWSTITMLKRVCDNSPTPSPYDPTGAIVGGVIGGFFGLLFLLLAIWFFCCRKKPAEPIGRPIPEPQQQQKPLAPVYLPQPYPSLPEQYAPAPMPAAPMPFTVPMDQPIVQPTLYSSYQAPFPAMPMDPYAQPQMFAAPQVFAQPGGYPAPYGVVPQPAFH